jgi:dihydroorotase
MGGSLTVRQARLVLPDRVVVGDLVVEDGVISEIAPRVDRTVGVEIDGRDRVLLPGAVDAVVSVDTIEDLSAVSSAAIAGGVTALGVVGPASTDAELKVELARAAELCRVHYGLYVRAVPGRAPEVERARGIWVGGDVLHDPSADELFAGAERLLVVDNQDPGRLASRARLWPDSTDPADHSRVHDVDSACSATRRAVELGTRHGRPMLLAAVSAAEELELLRSRPSSIAAATGPVHLFLDDSDYSRLGTRAVCNPPVRASRHSASLWDGLLQGTLDLICSRHASVRSEWKQRPYPGTPPGMPSVQWMLPLLLDAVRAGTCTWTDVARIACEAPARVLRLGRKGRLETGYDGDLVLVDPELEHTIGATAPSLAPGWSPWDGRRVVGWPVLTTVAGVVGFRDGERDLTSRGRAL